jgi:hypothetical protein
MNCLGLEDLKGPYKCKRTAVKVTEGTNGHSAGARMIMEQIANKDKSSIEREKTGTNMTSVQENARALNPSLLARVEAAIKEHPEFGVLRAKLLYSRA